MSEMVSVANCATGGTVGRRRKSGPREPNGKLQRNLTDHGHENALAHRAQLVGGDGRDPCAGYMLGVLLRRGVVTISQHDAGYRFKCLHAAVWGLRSVPSHLGMLVTGLGSSPSVDAEDAAKRNAELRHVTEIAQACGRRPFQLFCDVVVYDCPMQSRLLGSRTMDQLDLCKPLDALAAYWRIDRRI